MPSKYIVTLVSFMRNMSTKTSIFSTWKQVQDHILEYALPDDEDYENDEYKSFQEKKTEILGELKDDCVMEIDISQIMDLDYYCGFVITKLQL